jgi:hypothetical protein
LDISSRQAERLDAQKYDDKTFLEELVGNISDTLSGLQRYGAEMNVVEIPSQNN